MKGNAALLSALAVLLVAGCSIEVSPESVPVPISIAPTPSASAGVPKYVCSAAYKILTDGAVRLALDAAKSGDTARDGMRDTFTDMAAKLDAEAAGTSDAGLATALRDISSDLTAGARQSDPRAYVDGGFTTVGQKLDEPCSGA